MTHLPASYNRLNKAQARAIRARRSPQNNNDIIHKLKKFYKHTKNKIKIQTRIVKVTLHSTKGWRIKR